MNTGEAVQAGPSARSLHGRVCVITGAAERVGRTIAHSFANAGADVLINHWQQPDKAAQVVAELEAFGVSAFALEADVSEPATGPRLVQAAHDRFGRIDFLIHNASNFVEKPFGSVLPEDFDRSFGVNLRGPFFISQAFGNYMYSQGHGRIYAMVGNSYYETWPDFAAHTCAKVGLAKLMQILAIQYSPVVQANAVCPAQILPSPAGQDVHIAMSRGETSNHTARAVELVGNTAEDVAYFLTQLCLAPASLTGVVIPIDGGKSAL